MWIDPTDRATPTDPGSASPVDALSDLPLYDMRFALMHDGLRRLPPTMIAMPIP